MSGEHRHSAANGQEQKAMEWQRPMRLAGEGSEFRSAHLRTLLEKRLTNADPSLAFLRNRSTCHGTRGHVAHEQTFGRSPQQRRTCKDDECRELVPAVAPTRTGELGSLECTSRSMLAAQRQRRVAVRAAEEPAIDCWERLT